MNQLLFLTVSTFYTITYSWPVDHIGTVSEPQLHPHPVRAPFSNIGDITKKKIVTIINHSKPFPVISHFPDSGRKHAAVEYESPISKIDTAYGNLQQFVASFYNPLPVVDTIHEYQKYGNDGGKPRAVATNIIAGYEAFSNLLNAAIDVPYETIRQLTKKFATTASTVGAKIAGL